MTSFILKQTINDNITPEEIADLKKSDVNAFDRISVGNRSSAADNASDILCAVSIGIPSLLFIPQIYDRKAKNILTLSVMYGEAIMIDQGMTSIVKSIVQRKRPFLYDANLSPEERLEMPGKLRSFYSGHTSTSFCSAVFFAKVYSDIYPDSNWRYIVWPSVLAVAGSVGYLRYKAGKHYPTDIIAGAIAGSAVGYIIPVLHRKNNQENYVSISIQPRFIGLSYYF
jgi:hypothetical protein